MKTVAGHVGSPRKCVFPGDCRSAASLRRQEVAVDASGDDEGE